jgi:hypothetical protein
VIDDDEDDRQWHVPPFVWLTVGLGLGLWFAAAFIVWKLVSR